VEQQSVYLMPAHPVLLDVNVPMYAGGRSHPYREPCAWILTEVAQGSLVAAIDTEITQEILHHYGASGRFDLAVEMAGYLLQIVPTVYPMLLADAQLAIKLFRRYGPRGIKARDVIHIAIMQNNGIGTIISADRHFDGIDGVTRLDPLELFHRRNAGQS
jgi:predicted nucleic acid-binding protein